MQALGPICRIFAKPWDMRGLSQGFQGANTQVQYIEMLTVVGVMVAICGVLLLVDRYARNRRNRVSYNNPKELFRELCRVHRLDWSSRRLLKRLAAERGLTSPALLFVEPEFFNIVTLPANWLDNADQVKHIQRQLFGAH